MRVWVTRAEPEAARTAERLRAGGRRVLVAPLLRVAPLPAEAALAEGLKGAGALAFTSINGVRAFAHLRPVSDRGLTAYAIGGSTAAAARDAGFSEVIAGEGDSRALAALIADHAARPAGHVLYPGPLGPAGDLVGDLAKRKVEARAVAVYDTPACAPPAETLAELDAGAIDVVLIHSAKAARQLAEVLQDHPAIARIACVCISKAAAAPLKALALRRLVIAEAPNEAAMLAKLDE